MDSRDTRRATSCARSDTASGPVHAVSVQSEEMRSPGTEGPRGSTLIYESSSLLPLASKVRRFGRRTLLRYPHSDVSHGWRCMRSHAERLAFCASWMTNPHSGGCGTVIASFGSSLRGIAAWPNRTVQACRLSALGAHDALLEGPGESALYLWHPGRVRAPLHAAFASVSHFLVRALRSFRSQLRLMDLRLVLFHLFYIRFLTRNLDRSA